MTEYSPLDKTSFEMIYNSFVTAFSDYFVAMTFSPDSFRGMNVMRGVDSSASLGAFEDGGLIGFTLNGVGQWNGRLTAYDAGTAVFKDFRGRGISKEMFRRLLPLLKGRGIERYLLEVITANEGAFKLYRGLGFNVTRRFVCMKYKPGALRASVGTDARIMDVPARDWPSLRADMEKDSAFLPSWQNSWDSVLRLPGNFTVKAVYCGDQLAGYGIVARASGSIPQLWVKSVYRRAGFGSVLLRALSASAQTGGALSWVNVDEKAAGTIGFLEASGFERGLSQYEMEMGI